MGRVVCHASKPQAGRWKSIDAGVDMSDDQQDIMRGAQMVDSLFQVCAETAFFPNANMTWLWGACLAAPPASTHAEMYPCLTCMRLRAARVASLTGRPGSLANLPATKRIGSCCIIPHAADPCFMVELGMLLISTHAVFVIVNSYRALA